MYPATPVPDYEETRGKDRYFDRENSHKGEKYYDRENSRKYERRESSRKDEKYYEGDNSRQDGRNYEHENSRKNERYYVRENSRMKHEHEDSPSKVNKLEHSDSRNKESFLNAFEVIKHHMENRKEPPSVLRNQFLYRSDSRLRNLETENYHKQLFQQQMSHYDNKNDDTKAVMKSGSYEQWLTRSTPERRSNMGPPVLPKPSEYRNRYMDQYEMSPVRQREPFIYLEPVHEHPYRKEYDDNQMSAPPAGTNVQAYYHSERKEIAVPGQQGANVIVVPSQVNPAAQRSFTSYQNLPRKETHVTCSNCNIVIKTKVDYTSTKRTHFFAWCCCFAIGPLSLLGFYCGPCCKKGDHYCTSCHSYLGST